MKNRIEKFLDIIFENKMFKIFSVYLIGMLLFYLATSAVNRTIIKYFTIDEKLLQQVPNFIFVILFLLAIIYVVYKIALKKYQPSFFLLHLLAVLALIYVMLKWIVTKEEWKFQSFGYKFLYVDFIGLLLFVSIILIIKNLLGQKESKQKPNPFISDDPILLKTDDKLEYDKRATTIVEYLERSNFKNSFTIGIVGPWGNGKSSLISLIEEKLDETTIENTIHLKFLPYLNHSETDIISEFFKQLSTEINKYSGRLSNQFLNYSDKLLKLYNNRSISDFFKSNSNIFSDSSSYDTYKRINETLNQLNKKFIIFIDDLDRLSNNEVLQVLKLVRNTANFKNFIFLIALDKDYVLSSLLEKNDIADHTFVDKFFQLEVYLPEIDKSQLKTDFIGLLKKTDLGFEVDFISNVEKCIYRQDNLFDEYVSNYRGVKRLVNQLVFDFKLLPDELDTNDFLNFTYLKMTFPYAIKFLNNNWQIIIPYNPETMLCELVETEKVQNEEKSNRSLIHSMIFGINLKLDIDFDKYEISKSIDKKIKVNESNNLSKEQNILLVKTLIILFGKENIADTHKSIKFENNLRKVLQQKINENDLSEVKFKSIFNIDNGFDNLNKLLKEDHANSILNRITYFNTVDKDESLKIIVILLYIFDDAEVYGTHTSSIWKILTDFINRQFKMKIGSEDFWTTDDKLKIWDYITEEFLSEDGFKIENKIRFLSYISESRTRLEFSEWGVSEDDLKEQSFTLYKALLEIKQDILWDIDDYSFYHVYHDVRKFHKADEINPITIEFWSKNDITLLCAQMTENDAWTTKMLKTSDYASQLFGSKQMYKDFITANLPNPITPELKEYIDFLQLESYTLFTHYIRYEFSNFDLIKQKLQRVIDNNNLRTDEFDNIIEIVLKSTTKKLWELTNTEVNRSKISGFVDARKYNSEALYFTFIKFETGTYNKSKEELFKHFQDKLKNEKINSEIDFKDKSITIKGTSEKIKIISVQPSSYN